MSTLLSHLETLIAAQTHQQLRTRSDNALKYLPLVQLEQYQYRFNPNKLPVGLSNPVQRAPFETEAQLSHWFLGNNAQSSVNSATRWKRSSMRKRELSHDAQENPFITPEIQALAEELNFHPVKIYNFVHDQIAFVPTYGAVQNPQMTLDLKRGNGFDIAQLLATLLNAANIPTKYAYGTVNIGTERVLKWLGTGDINEARNLLALGGIPNTALVSGGTIKNLKIEHIWVDGWIDFMPSGGARHRKGDMWVPLDASFKQHTFTPGINLAEAVPFDLEGLRDHLIASTQVDAEGGITGIDASYLLKALRDYQAQLHNYIQANNINPADLLAKKTIMKANRRYLSAGLPYQLIKRGGYADEIPAHLRSRLSIKFYHSLSAQMLDNPTLSYTLSLPTLGSKRLNVTYVPATDADAKAIDAIRASGIKELPLYLFNVKPQLKLDDSVLAEGTAIGMGQQQYYTFIITDPYNSYTENGHATSGDEIVFGVNGNGITPSLVQKRLEQVPFDSAGENLHQTGLHFWMEHDRFDALAAQTYGVHSQRMPSVGTFLVPLTVKYAFGIPQSGYYKQRQIDVKRNVQTVTVWGVKFEPFLPLFFHPIYVLSFRREEKSGCSRFKISPNVEMTV